MSRGRFLSLKVREGKEPKERTLTPHEDGFLKNFKKKEVTRMRKYLALILVALLAISFVPFRFTGTHAVYAYDKTPVTMIANAWQDVQAVTAPPHTLELVDSAVTVQRYFSFYWDETADWDGDNDPNTTVMPELATDFYATVVSEGSLSELKDHYYVVYVVVDGEEQVYIDPDTHFDVPGSTAWANTMGPFGVGDYVTLDYGPAAGRTFQIGLADMDDSGGYTPGDLFLFFEVLTASCCGNSVVYDISVESDVEPVDWGNPLVNDPVATAVLGPGTGSDFAPITHELARSTAYNVSTTTFFDIELTNREFLDLEIFRDDGTDNNDTDLATPPLVPDNLSDDYNPLTTGEEFVGAVDGDGLTTVANAVGYIIDSLSGNIVYVYDTDNSATFTAGDVILESTAAGWFKGVGVVSSGDVNLTAPLATVYAAGTVGTVVLQGVTFYGPMNTWADENPVSGITMVYGDFRGMDITVLPGNMDLNVTIETEAGVTVDELKVEQTYTVWVSLPDDCVLPAGAKVHVVLELPGYDTQGDPYYEVIKYFTLDNNHRSEKTHNVTGWRGSLYPDMVIHVPPMFRVRAFAEICGALGPEDGYYGDIYIPELDATGENIVDVVPFENYVDGKFGKYDCWYEEEWPINPEDLVLDPNKECISPLDQRWPNIGFSLSNADNPEDVDDPSGAIYDTTADNLWGYVNAHGNGIEWINAGNDGANDYIIQFNSDLSIYVWLWNDDGDQVFEPGEVTTQPVYDRGPFSLVDNDDDGIPSPGDVLTDGVTAYTLYGYALPSDIDTSGMIYALVKVPKSGCAEVEFTVFTTDVIYNFVGPQPPLYLDDPDFSLIDYLGKVNVTVTKVYDVNFAEFEIVDEGLKGSPFFNPYPPYGLAVNQYPWVLQNLMMELRSYPGGQTLLEGSGWGNDYNNTPLSGPVDAQTVVGLLYGFNSRHAQFRSLFWKLGTEYYPLTNYTIRFIVKDAEGNHLSFDAGTLASIEIVGEKADPNAQPVFIWRPYLLGDNAIPIAPALTDGPYTYLGTHYLPRGYDTSGDILITDDTFEYDGYTYDDGWPFEFDDVQVITGIIPTGPGMIKIIVTDAAGHTNSFKWCTSCSDNPEGVPVHAIELTGFPESITVDKDTTLDITAKVYPYDKDNSPWGETTITTNQPLANQVIMFVWQDRGVEDPVTGLRYGVGDGWITGQTPKYGGSPIDLLLASPYNAGPVYNAYDWNGDGVISFADKETEIVGTFDIATQTWQGGFVTYSAMTNHINDGKYLFDLTSANGAQIDEIGFDFDGNSVLLTDEEIPVRITAYTYGDDGVNPREATLTPGMGWEPWEVYLAGQVDIPVVGVEDWNVDTEPCLTAGVLPEAQPDGKPLTFIVTDAEGNPVDLSVGIGGGTVNDIMIWNGLFDDEVPAPLPEYYWVRTDLHNDAVVVDPDTGLAHLLNAYAANDMYVYAPYDWNGDGIADVDTNGNALEPIKPDFTEMSDGIYKFNGFVANDKGEFEVYVYSPDRKHYGVATVKVELPDVSYEITNVEDETGTVFTVPGDPDFTMTAGDIRIYKVTVTAKDCEGKPIASPGPVGECEPPTGGIYAGFLPYMGYTPHYYNWVGADFDGDGDVYFNEWVPFGAYASTYDNIYEGGAGEGKVYGPHDWTHYLFYWGNRTADGFMGQQGIYNSQYDIGPWAIGNMYPDINADGVIDINDTFALDENGQATFYVETDDISALSGIVGKNPYVTIFDTGAGTYDLGDVAGWSYMLSSPRYRFGADGNGSGLGADYGFFLDWYGNANRQVDVDFMKFEILNGETHEELGKEIFNENYYDLTYGLENHLVVHALPADDRDLPVREGVQVQLVGNVETWAYGTLMHNDDGVAETTLNFLPRGVGARVAYLAVVTRWGADAMWNNWIRRVFIDDTEIRPWFTIFNSPGEVLYWTYDDRAPDNTMVDFAEMDGWNSASNIYYFFTGNNLATPFGHDLPDMRGTQRIAPPVGSSSWPLPYFDAAKGLGLSLKGDLTVGVETEIAVKVVEAGPNFPVAGAEVTLYGAGVDLVGTTDADGVATFSVKPTEAGDILITATKDGYISGKMVVSVGADTIPPELTVDKPASPTNEATVTITGTATDNSGSVTVAVNGVEAEVGADGKFSAEVTLTEGENEITVVAKDPSGNKTEKTVVVVLDTVPPELTVDALPEPLTSTTVKLSGKVEEGAKVMVNDVEATVAHDYWEAEVELEYGENIVTVTATDAVGNETAKEITVVVYKKTVVELQIGNPMPRVNGEYGEPYEAAPYIKNGRTMVPLRLIAEAFGATVEWIPETRGINITLDLDSAKHTIGLQVGNPTAIVDGEVFALDVAPEIVNGRTFVPIRFIAEAFGADVGWDSLTRTVTITFLWY